MRSSESCAAGKPSSERGYHASDAPRPPAFGRSGGGTLPRTARQDRDKTRARGENPYSTRIRPRGGPDRPVRKRDRCPKRRRYVSYSASVASPPARPRRPRRAADRCWARGHRVERDLRALEASLAAETDPARRLRLEGELAEKVALQGDEEERVRGLALAILGLTVLSPDPRAQAIVRVHQLAMVDRHLARGEELAAVVALHRVVREAGEGNILGLTQEQAAAARAKLALAEERLAAARSLQSPKSPGNEPPR